MQPSKLKEREKSKKQGKQPSGIFDRERVHQEYALPLGSNRGKRRKKKDVSVENNWYPNSTGRSSMLGQSGQASTLQLATSRTHSNTRDTFMMIDNNSTSSLFSLHLLDPKIRPVSQKRRDVKDKNLKPVMKGRGMNLTLGFNKKSAASVSGSQGGKRTKQEDKKNKVKKRQGSKEKVKKERGSVTDRNNDKIFDDRKKSQEVLQIKKYNGNEKCRFELSDSCLNALESEKFRQIEMKLSLLKNKKSAALIKNTQQNDKQKTKNIEFKPKFSLSTKIESKNPYLIEPEKDHKSNVKPSLTVPDFSYPLQISDHDKRKVFDKDQAKNLKPHSRDGDAETIERHEQSFSPRSTHQSQLLPKSNNKISRKSSKSRKKRKKGLVNGARLETRSSAHTRFSGLTPVSSRASIRTVSRKKSKSKSRKNSKKRTSRSTSRISFSSARDHHHKKKKPDLSPMNLYFNIKPKVQDLKKSVEHKKAKRMEKAWKNTISKTRKVTEETLNNSNVPELLLSPFSEQQRPKMKSSSKKKVLDFNSETFNAHSASFLKKKSFDPRKNSKKRTKKSPEAQVCFKVTKTKSEPSTKTRISNKKEMRPQKTHNIPVPHLEITPNPSQLLQIGDLQDPQDLLSATPEPSESPRPMIRKPFSQSRGSPRPLEEPLTEEGPIEIPSIPFTIPAQGSNFPILRLGPSRNDRLMPNPLLHKRDDSIDEPICIKNDSGNEGIKEGGDRVTTSHPNSAQYSLSVRQQAETSTPMISETDIENQFRKFMENQESNFQSFAKIIDRLTAQPKIQNSLFQKCLSLKKKGEMSIRMLKESVNLNTQIKTERKSMDKQSYSINIGEQKTAKENPVSPETSPVLSETPKNMETQQASSIGETSKVQAESNVSTSQIHPNNSSLPHTFVLQQTKVFPIAEIIYQPEKSLHQENMEEIKEPTDAKTKQTSLRSKFSNMALNPTLVSPTQLTLVPQIKSMSSSRTNSAERLMSPTGSAARFTEKWVEFPQNSKSCQQMIFLSHKHPAVNKDLLPENLEKSDTSIGLIKTFKNNSQNLLFGSMNEKTPELIETEGREPLDALSQDPLDSLKNSQILIRDEITHKSAKYDNLEHPTDNSRPSEASLASSNEDTKKAFLGGAGQGSDESAAVDSCSEPIKIEDETEKDRNDYVADQAGIESMIEPSVPQELGQPSEKVSAGASIDFANLTSEDKAFAIADFILENLIVEVFTLDYRTRERMTDTAKKINLRKQTRSTQEISKYLGQIFTLINESPEEQLEIYTRLNTPLVMTDTQRLMLASSLIPSEDQMALGKIDYESVLSIQLYIRLEETLRDTEYVSRNLSHSQVEREHIVHKLLFDSLNERLDYSRVQGMLPCPPRFSSKFVPSPLITPDDCARILEQSKRDVIDWSLEKYGILMDPQLQATVGRPNPEEPIDPELQKDDGLSRHLSSYIQEIESKWYLHHDEILEVFISNCDSVFDCLVEDCVADLQNIMKKKKTQSYTSPVESVYLHSSPITHPSHLSASCREDKDSPLLNPISPNESPMPDQIQGQKQVTDIEA